MKRIYFLLTSALCVLSAYAETQAMDNKRLEMMQALQYTDEQQCYVKMGDETPRAIVHQLVASYGLPTIDNAMVMQALQAAIERGCSLQVLDENGLSPLHTAILFNQAEVVQFLLAHGADKHQRIERQGSPVDGLTANEFLDWILINSVEKGDLRDRSAVQTALTKTQ